MTLRFEHKEYVLETELVDIDPDTATPEELASYTKHSDDATKVDCIMIATMNPELMQGYVERLRKLEMPVHEDLAVDIVLDSLPSSYDQFTMAYYLNNSQATLAELHRMLRIAEDGMKDKSVPSVSQPVLAIGSGKGKMRKGPPNQNWREKVHVGSSSNGPRPKSSGISHVANPKEADCFLLQRKGSLEEKLPERLAKLKGWQSKAVYSSA
ncbi:hypothetical protein L2E82_45709 [Cichorium intybus]|uniref:Uncharacterized protein n=1 Tax=Cichorium intybus TaxID=13427 RepID=A0ACB8ZUQ4_CICIN|nr:hypothetical protein L2E82_45709 [Cichorium intybus]